MQTSPSSLQATMQHSCKSGTSLPLQATLLLLLSATDGLQLHTQPILYRHAKHHDKITGSTECARNRRSIERLQRSTTTFVNLVQSKYYNEVWDHKCTFFNQTLSNWKHQNMDKKFDTLINVYCDLNPIDIESKLYDIQKVPRNIDNWPYNSRDQSAFISFVPHFIRYFAKKIFEQLIRLQADKQ